MDDQADSTLAALTKEYVEPSIQEAFAKLWTNEACHDIVLKCSDGVEVSANRFALAVRSPYFEKICLGKFTEANSGIIESKYPSNVMTAIMEYIHTGTTELVDMKKGKMGKDDDVAQVHADIDRVQSQVKLATAAVYYDLPGLGRRLNHRFLRSLRQKPSLAFALLEACHQEEPETPEELQSLALSTIRSIKSTASLDNKSIGVLSQTVLQSILEDEKLEADDAILFEIIRLWSAQQQTPHGEGRLTIATKLVEQHIKLELIDPHVLSSSIEPSGLVTSAQLVKAYKEQAFAAKESYGMAFKKPRYVPPYGKWKTSLSDIVTLDGLDTGNGDILHFAPVTIDKQEVHKWTIKIEEADKDSVMWLGFANSDMGPADLTCYLAKQKLCLGYSSDGKAWGWGKLVESDFDPVKFNVGDEVTLTLNLKTAVDNEYPLDFDIINRPTTIGLASLLIHIPNLPKPPAGLVPAVSVGNNSRARFRFISYECSQE